MYVYVLLSSKDQKFYIGISENPDRRLLDHNQGLNKSTKGRRPFILLYKEFFGDSILARKREVFFKSASGRRYLKKLFPCSPPQVSGG